jgi:alkylation response protein AidB-like acyl-CoA dehydrogenase
MWISNAEISGVYLVMANTNPQAVDRKILFDSLDRFCFFLL